MLSMAFIKCMKDKINRMIVSLHFKNIIALDFKETEQVIKGSYKKIEQRDQFKKMVASLMYEKGKFLSNLPSPITGAAFSDTVPQKLGMVNVY